MRLFSEYLVTNEQLCTLDEALKFVYPVFIILDGHPGTYLQKHVIKLGPGEPDNSARSGRH